MKRTLVFALAALCPAMALAQEVTLRLVSAFHLSRFATSDTSAL